MCPPPPLVEAGNTLIGIEGKGLLLKQTYGVEFPISLGSIHSHIGPQKCTVFTKLFKEKKSFLFCIFLSQFVLDSIISVYMQNQI